MELVYLSRADVEALEMSMKDVLQAVDNGFRLKGMGKTEMPPKPGIHPRPDCFIHAMPAYVQEVESAGLKWVSGFPPNAAKGLPYITGMLVLNDPDTGIPIAVMDCAWITAMRTGASVGISAKYLAREDSTVAGILGCGVQARTSLMALVETLGQLREVRCNDLFPEATEKFIAEMSEMFGHLQFETCDSPQAMANGADVMSPGIVDADRETCEGGGVWVRDERNFKPLAIGLALMSGEEMRGADKGKAIKTIHFVGDKIWNVGDG